MSETIDYSIVTNAELEWLDSDITKYFKISLEGGYSKPNTSEKHPAPALTRFLDLKADAFGAMNKRTVKTIEIAVEAELEQRNVHLMPRNILRDYNHQYPDYRRADPDEGNDSE